MTDPTSTREELRRSEERFRLMVSSIKDYAIFLLDPDGRVATWNAGAQAIKGYVESEIVGKHIEIFYPPELRAEGRPQKLLRQAAEQGRAHDENWRVRKDGTRFWADAVITALHDETGKLVGFAKVTHDLTARKAAEDKLRESEERFRLMISSVKDYAIFMLDPEGHVATWNEGARAIKGYEASEIIGKHIEVFYPPEARAEGRPRRLLGIAAEQGRVEDENWRMRKDGTRFWADSVITALRSPQGKLLGFAKVTRDLTERRHLEEERLQRAQAEEAIRLRDEFLSIASHELKTPLTALQLQLQSLRQRVDDLDARIVSKVDRATQSGVRLANLIETLLDVSRISTGKFELSPEAFDLCQLARDLAERLHDAAAAAGCAIGVSTPEEPVSVRWDRLRIEQVITNLLSNAIKYGAGHPVLLSMLEQGPDALILVSDRGPGIPEKDKDRIFGRFERAVSTRHYGGMGLGLYVARQIVEAHAGTIAASNSPSGGAVFTVRIPRAPSVRPVAVLSSALQERN